MTRWTLALVSLVCVVAAGACRGAEPPVGRLVGHATVGKGAAADDVVLTLEGASHVHVLRQVPRLVESQNRFHPRMLAVKTGTPVEFYDLDLYHHNPFSFSRFKKFDLGRFEGGQRRSILFDQPGVVKVFCSMHSVEKAYVYVTDANACTVPLANDSYAFGDVTQGNYQLLIWCPNREPTRRPVTIAPGGFTQVDLDLR